MEESKVILISGTSSGIGKACALHLDKMGFKVYAGVRKKSDGDNLKREASNRLKPLLLDVTSHESITTTADIIDKETGGEIFGLINNAGIGLGGVLEVTPVAEIRKLIEVNLIGMMAVTQAFIPMIRNSAGRIINIGSSSSFVAAPGAGIYAASKFAVRAFTDSLRRELKPFDISVILVAPGAVESEIWEKGRTYIEKLRQSVSNEIAQLYAPLAKFADKLNSQMKKIPASEVAEAAALALTVKKPKPIYLVGHDSKRAARLSNLPIGILDWMIMKRIQRMGK